jgi:8-amino-7-oxononanoate synthase
MKQYQDFLDKNPYPRQLINYENKYSEKNLINFSSNDYLGLSKHPLLIQRSQAYMQSHGIGVSSSRLVAGNIRLFDELEQKLAIALNKPTALIIGTGYQTNFTVLEALLDKTVLGHTPLVFCDRWCHNSIISSVCHYSEVNRFRHNDLAHLYDLLKAHHAASGQKFIIVESLYSMDGDRADLSALIRLAKLFNAFLYVDDAHSVGIYGDKGWGLASQFGGDIDIIMGTFSKGLGSFGGYIGCSETIKEYLTNKCKGLIYSTALPVPILGAISAAIEILPELTETRQRIINHAQKLLTFFRENKLNCGASASHIVPWIVGDAERTLLASQLLIQEGILGVTIRPPSVPVGQSRIRFCLSASHQNEHIEQLMRAILNVARQLA